MKTVRILILYRVDKNNKNIIIIIVDEILVEKRTPVVIILVWKYQPGFGFRIWNLANMNENVKNTGRMIFPLIRLSGSSISPSLVSNYRIEVSAYIW